jgi:serine/threonine-protein kinase
LRTPVPADGSAPGAKDGAKDGAPHYTPIPGTGTKRYKRVGDYDIVSKLGQGAMGSVYLAKNVVNEQLVALKILPPDMAKDEELLQRFKREARATQRISHPNIVSAVEVGMFDKFHYIAMEYVDGPDLETQLKRSGKFKTEVLLRVASEMCSALEEIERQGIVHRDMKPSNILMTSKGRFRLTDLGLASAGQGDQRLTLAGFAVGTPYYLSPEQARGEPNVDIRADIYGLGATLYHLATGEVPFPGDNPVMVMTHHINKELVLPHVADPEVPESLSALIQHMMQKDEKRRPQNCTQLREDIECCVRGEIPQPRGVQRIPARVQPIARRRPSGANALPVVREESKTQPAPQSDGLPLLDALLGFLPKDSRIPAAIGALAVACMGVLAAIVYLLLHFKR